MGRVKSRSEIVLLCEDQQHQAFASRFLERMGWNPRQVRRLPLIDGKGSAVQYVTRQFPEELRALRRRAVDACLVVVIDGDADGVAARKEQLLRSCSNAGIELPRPEDRVLVCTPTWNIETWLAYLSGETVDEALKNYPFPLSLEAACENYRRLFT